MTNEPSQGLLLVGAGGHGRVVADLAEACGWNDIAFVDDQFPDLARNFRWPVLGTLGDLQQLLGQYANAVSTIGDNDLRLQAHLALLGIGFRVPTLIHPSAIISNHASLDNGTVAMANVVVNAATRIGQGVILNTACTVDHDCVLGDGAHVSPGAHLAGHVVVGQMSWIGIGASVRGGARIGDRATVGGGAMVVSDVPDGAVYAGVPAAPLKRARPEC